MDPFAHTFTAGALAASGLRKTTPLATAALLLGANAPDIDIFISYAGDYMSLAHRRGWSHGVLAWIVLPVALTGLLLAWDRWVRRRRHPTAPAADGRILLALSTLAVLSHPALDWLNNYGIRLLMPFDDRWFYGDALFIIDPWVWLMLGGACFLYWSQSRWALLGWGVFWLASTALVLGNGLAPTAARYLWLGGLAGLICWRVAATAPVCAVIPRGALALVVLYSGGNILASLAAESRVAQLLRTQGYGEANQIMVGPVAANPLRGTVVATVEDRYLVGQWDWRASAPLTVTTAIAKNLEHPVVAAAAGHPHARRYLTWSRFPYAVVETAAGRYRVRFADARYAGFDGGIGGPVITVAQNMELSSRGPGGRQQE